MRFSPELTRKPQGLHAICRKHPEELTATALSSLLQPQSENPWSGPKHSQAALLSFVDTGRSGPWLWAGPPTLSANTGLCSLGPSEGPFLVKYRVLKHFTAYLHSEAHASSGLTSPVFRDAGGSVWLQNGAPVGERSSPLLSGLGLLGPPGRADKGPGHTPRQQRGSHVHRQIQTKDQRLRPRVGVKAEPPAVLLQTFWARILPVPLLQPPAPTSPLTGTWKLLNLPGASWRGMDIDLSCAALRSH